jgi:hypothetical protein
MPVEARGTSKKSAKAFVRYYVDVLNHAAATGDTTDLRSSSDPDCRACRGIYSKIDKVYDSGGFFRGEGWEIERMRVVRTPEPGRVVVQADVAVAPQDVRPGRREEVEHFAGGNQAVDFRLRRRSGWVVERMDSAL